MSDLMINGLTGQELRDRLDGDHWSAKLLAEVVCSTYWGRVGVVLKDLGGLDESNWDLAVSIMAYRRENANWTDEGFWALATWCKTRHDLQHYTLAD